MSTPLVWSENEGAETLSLPEDLEISAQKSSESDVKSDSSEFVLVFWSSLEFGPSGSKSSSSESSEGNARSLTVFLFFDSDLFFFEGSDSSDDVIKSRSSESDPSSPSSADDLFSSTVSPSAKVGS
jgi:hypothetical protein